MRGFTKEVSVDVSYLKNHLHSVRLYCQSGSHVNPFQTIFTKYNFDFGGIRTRGVKVDVESIPQQSVIFFVNFPTNIRIDIFVLYYRRFIYKVLPLPSRYNNDQKEEKSRAKISQIWWKCRKEFGCCKFNSIFDDHDVLSLDHVHF